MITVYIIKSKEWKVYVGMSKNVDERVILHNSGKVRSTKSGSDWKIIYSEEFASYKEARLKEKYFKTNAGKEWLKRRKIL